ncbi:hypothetical protein BHE74_00024033, partial [Ensete ventricosum]
TQTRYFSCMFKIIIFFSSSDGAMAGATAGVVVETVLYPIDTIKTRLQVVVKQRMQTGQFTSAPNAVRLIVAKEGVRALLLIAFSISVILRFPFLQGYSSFLLRDLPFDAIQFCIYEQIRIGYKIAVRFI